MKVLVKKTELLERVKSNRNDHREMFLKALEGYRRKVIGLFEESIEQIKRGDKIANYIGMMVPEDHTDDYDCIISMIEMDIREELEIEQKQYRWYVLDDWEWKEGWTASNTAYLAP